jgi:hypothetical protein
MKSPVLDTRRKAVIASANAFPGGLAYASDFLGEENLKRFKNRIYESAGVRPLTDDEVCTLETEARTTFLPDYICAMYGGVFVRLPEVGDLDNVDMHQRSLRTSVKRGRVDQFLALALEDGEITAAEAAEILALHAKHLAARHEEVTALIELHKSKRPAPPPSGKS